MIHRIQFEQWVPAPIEKVFLFFANPTNLPRIMPPETGTELAALRLVPPPTASTEPPALEPPLRRHTEEGTISAIQASP